MGPAHASQHRPRTRYCFAVQVKYCSVYIAMNDTDPAARALARVLNLTDQKSCLQFLGKVGVDKVASKVRSWQGHF